MPVKHHRDASQQETAFGRDDDIAVGQIDQIVERQRLQLFDLVIKIGLKIDSMILAKFCE